MLNQLEKYRGCPICGTRSPLIVDLETELVPILSPKHTPMYFCPLCDKSFYEGKNALTEEQKVVAHDGLGDMEVLFVTHAPNAHFFIEPGLVFMTHPDIKKIIITPGDRGVEIRFLDPFTFEDTEPSIESVVPERYAGVFS
jgi:hypothetical protein